MKGYTPNITKDKIELSSKSEFVELGAIEQKKECNCEKCDNDSCECHK